MSDIVIQIKTNLMPVNPAEVQRVQQQVQQMVKPVSMKVDLSKANLEKLGHTFKQVGDGANDITERVKQWSPGIGTSVKQVEKMDAATGNVLQTVTKTTQSFSEQSKQWSNRVKETMENMTRTPDALVKMRQHYQDLSKEAVNQQKLQDDFNKRNINAIDYQIKQRETQGQQFSKGLQTRLRGEEQVSANISKQGQMLEKISNLQKTYAEPLKRQDLQQTSAELNKMTKEVQNLDTSSKSFNKELGTKSDRLKVLENDTKRVNMQMKQGSHFVQIFGQSIFEAGKKFATWMLVASIVMQPVRAIRDGIKTVRELDAELTQLRKVTGATMNTVGDFAVEANKMAIEIGATTGKVIEQATAWARLGYSIEQAGKLAGESILLSVVGNMDIDKATSSLVSTMKAFNIEAENSRVVIDAVNFLPAMLATA